MHPNAHTLEGAAVAAELERRLRQALSPIWLSVRDDSERHRGHAGWRASGGTHFAVTIVAEAFRGLSRLERQRRIYAAVGDLMGAPIHALQIEARSPEEAPPTASAGGKI
jgi:BolA protein